MKHLVNMWSLLFQKGTQLNLFDIFLVFSESPSQFWSYDHVRHIKIIFRTFLTNPWEIFDLRSQIFLDLRSSRDWAFSQPWHPKWVKMDLKNFRKSIFEVKKSIFSFYVRKPSWNTMQPVKHIQKEYFCLLRPLQSFS